MNYRCSIAALAGLSLLQFLLIPTTASGAIGSVVLSRSGNYGGANGGGAFLATPDDGNPFTTFCLEYNEHISLGTTYKVTIDDAAFKGGGGAIPGGPFSTQDFLSQQTAWLYANYVAGTLNSYTLVGSSLGNFVYNDGTWANIFQKVVWDLEGEITPTYSVSLSDEILALKNLAALNASNSDIPTGGYVFSVFDLDGGYTEYTVRVMNLYTKYPTDDPSKLAQSQLYYTSTYFPPLESPDGQVPEPMTLAMWSGLSILGLGMARRHRRKVSA